MSSAFLNEAEESTETIGKPSEKYLKSIITQNLATGHYDEDAQHDFDLDSKSLYISAASLNSLSQPNTPKHLSLSPVSMMTTSSISELSTECQDDNDTESCASLNSVQSAHSTDVYYSNQFIDDDVIIHEHKENPDPFDSLDRQHSLSNDDNDDNDNSTHSHSHSKSSRCVSRRHPHQRPSRARSQKKAALRKTASCESTVAGKQRMPLHHQQQQRRNSKDCLNITKLSVLVTKPIETWSVSEVVEWLKIIDCGTYKEYADRFRAKHVDGKKLFKLTRSMLQSLEVNHPSARKAILAALQRLKSKVRQVAKRQVDLFAASRGYSAKKKQQQHTRGESVTAGESEASHELYVMAIKRHSVDDDNGHHANNDQDIAAAASPMCAPLPMKTSVSVPHRKTSHDISEFLDAWELKHRHSSSGRDANAAINFLNSRILEQTDKFTMIELESGRIVYAVTARVEKWSTADVCSWLNSVANGRYKRFIGKFRERSTNGFDLLNLSRVQLQNHMAMMDPKMRSMLLREIKLLKLATQPGHGSPKKRASMSTRSVNAPRQLKSSKSSPSHRKSASIGSPSMASRSSCELSPPRARKLGPRDIGRVRGYKGTQYKASMFNYDFMQERLNYKATTAAFNRRKHQNPVQHKQTVDEIGVNAEFEKPEYCEQVLSDAQRSLWLQERPLSRRNGELEKLRGVKIEKGCAVSEYGAPMGWTPIRYKYCVDGKDFLAPHFWFDSSGVQFDFETLSRVLSYLPQQKLVELSKGGTPTGYESKLNYLRSLLTMVQEEREVIAKEDAADQLLMEERRKAGRHRRRGSMNEADSEEDGGDTKEAESVDTKEEKSDDASHPITTATADETESSPLKQKLNQTRLNLNAVVSALNETGNSSASSSSETDTDTDHEHKAESRLSESDQEMTSSQKRILYKQSRSRANTVLTNSTLNAPKQSSPQQQRPLSARDRNRRRFMSHESIASIQAMITNIEKQRESENVE